jgi:Ca2+/Na+ antiporter
MKELLIVLGFVALVVAFEWISNELAKEANWFLALTFFSVFTYFLIKVVKESKK